VSFVTLGRKGVEKRVRDAQNEIRQSTETEIKKLKGSLSKAKKDLGRQTEKLSTSEATMKRRLNAESSKVTDLKLELESLTRELDQERDRNRPLMAENATLARDNRVLKAGLSDLKAAFETGDIDRLKKGLIKMTEPEKPKAPEKPSRPRIDWDDEPDSDLPGLR
jgi:chromosome segregation ATPase